VRPSLPRLATPLDLALTRSFPPRPAPGGIFTAVSVGQMILWAIKKKAAYKKEFGATKAFPKGRKAIFPGLI
jgi:hypothetical protein